MACEKTLIKARAILRACEEGRPYDYKDLPMIVAKLTSESKEEREAAKAKVREMVRLGSTLN